MTELTRSTETAPGGVHRTYAALPAFAVRVLVDFFRTRIRVTDESARLVKA